MSDIEKEMQEIEEIIRRYNPTADFGMLRKAFAFAEKAHKGQLRKLSLIHISRLLF